VAKGVFAAVVLAIALPGASYAAPTGLVSCGASNVPDLVADFDVPNGLSVFEHLPLLGLTPELSDPAGPLYTGPLNVTVFAGDVCGVPVHLPLLAGGASSSVSSPVLHNVVRITRTDGDAWYLSDVDLSQLVP
jgi:hypothetical protein